MNPVRLLAFIEAETVTGPAKNLLQFAQLARTGNFTPALEVGIATFVRPGQETNLFLETAKRAEIHTFPVPERGRFDRSVIGSMRSIAEQFQPHLLQTHAVKSHFLARTARLHRAYPWNAFHHGYTWPDMRARAYNELDRWSLRAAHQVLTVSLPFRDQLIVKGVSGSRIQIIHNAIDPDWGRRLYSPSAQAALKEELHIRPMSRVLLIVGRLSREKDHLTLLRALRDIHATSPDSTPHLIIVGEGPERPRIEAAIEAYRLKSHVSLVGQKKSAEPYYTIADIAILSSLSEGSPNALLEGMAAGVPIIATRVGGIPEMVNHQESALLINPSDHVALAGAIKTLLENPALCARLVSAAHRSVVERHSPESRTQSLCRVYADLLRQWV